jgi:hypothetical protein
MQHASLSAERWSALSLEQQILSVANEMNRASKLFGAEDRSRLISCYERILRLVDLTVETNAKPALRRELLRLRDLVAELYLDSEPEAARHRAIFKALLLLHPVAARQIPFVFMRP